MRPDELGLEAVEQRMNRLTANAKAAKERAKQLKTQADMDADRLEQQKARKAQAQLQRAA